MRANAADTRAEDTIGRDLYDSNDERIGEIADIYFDVATGEPEWFAVRTGMFGMRVSFVPIEGTGWEGDDLYTTFTKAQVKDSPNAEADGALAEDEGANSTDATRRQGAGSTTSIANCAS